MRGGTLLIWGHRVKGEGQLWHSVYQTLCTRYRLQFLPNHFQTSHVSCGWWEKEPYWFWVTGSKIKVNCDTLWIRPCGHDTDFAQSLSNFICKLSMMREGTLLIWGHGIKGQGQLWHSVYMTLWSWYRLQFMPNQFQTLYVSCGWWEEEPYWFGVTGSKVKLTFSILCIRPCGHNIDYSFCPITFKLLM